jgi:hypothetical protein
MANESDRAELSTLRAQVQDVTARVTTLAERYDETPDSAIAADLFAAERALIAAQRALLQADTELADA